MDKDKKILLLFPSIFYYPQDIERLNIKSQLLYLLSFLRPHYQVHIVDLETEIGRPNSGVTIRRFKEKAKALLSQIPFDIVGISCWTSLSFRASVTVAQLIKEIDPTATIVVGGYHPSAVPGDFNYPGSPFDFVVIGEGEGAFLKICKGEVLKQQGTCILHEDTARLEELPFLDLGEATKIKNPQGRLASPFYLYLSRGCPFSCNFCMESVKRNRGWRSLSPDKAIEQIQRVVEELDPYSLALADACFGINPKWRKEFLAKLGKLKFDKFFSLETHPNLLDKEDVDFLSDLKAEVQLGVESGSSSMLKTMHKANDPSSYLNRFEEISFYLSEKRVLHRANLIFNHPGETHNTVLETISFMKKMMARDSSYLFWEVGEYVHFPGSQIDSHLDYYDKTFGTKIAYPQWWKMEEDQWNTSRKVLPSRDFTWEDLDFWRWRIREIDDLMKNSLAKEALDYVSRCYRFDWK